MVDASCLPPLLTPFSRFLNRTINQFLGLRNFVEKEVSEQFRIKPVLIAKLPISLVNTLYKLRVRFSVDVQRPTLHLLYDGGSI